MKNRLGQVLYISHGGGPLPLLKDPSHADMVSFMTSLTKRIAKPKHIIVISAHWEASEFTIQSGVAPELFYDYYGFPEEAYRLTYPCQGAPDLADRVAKLIEQAGIPVQLDPNRPYDHGSYIPLLLMYPEADIPVIQISLNKSLQAKDHIALGKALQALLDEPILIIGSGFSFHNMRAFEFLSASEAPRSDPRNDAFQEKLAFTVCQDPSAELALENWSSFPHAAYCHPREEHLLPLHVCVGAASTFGEKVFDGYILGKRALAFLW